MNQNNPIRLILARHGNTFETGQTPVQVGSRTDMPLTSDGRKQAHQLGKYMTAKGITPRAIYSGPLKRQIETATIIGEELHLEKTVRTHEPALVEIDYGLWEGLTNEEVLEKWSLEYVKWTQQAIWGEGIFGGSLQEHLAAIKHWLSELRKKYSPGDTVLGVTSNGIIRFFYSLQKNAWEQLVNKGGMEDLKVKTGNFCEISLFKDSIEVIDWNVSPKI